MIIGKVTTSKPTQTLKNIKPVFIDPEKSLKIPKINGPQNPPISAAAKNRPTAAPILAYPTPFVSIRIKVNIGIIGAQTIPETIKTTKRGLSVNTVKPNVVKEATRKITASAITRYPRPAILGIITLPETPAIVAIAVQKPA